MKNIKNYISILFLTIFSSSLLIAKRMGPDGMGFAHKGMGWIKGKMFWLGLGLYTKIATLLVLVLILVALIILILKMKKKK